MNERTQGGTAAAPSGGAEPPLRGGGGGSETNAAPGRKLAWSRPSVRVMDIERTLSGQMPVNNYLEGAAGMYPNVHS